MCEGELAFSVGCSEEGVCSKCMCYDMSPYCFTDVDRDLNIFCICYSLIFYSSGLSALSPTPNLESLVITICLVPILQPTRSTGLQLT